MVGYASCIGVIMKTKTKSFFTKREQKAYARVMQETQDMNNVPNVQEFRKQRFTRLSLGRKFKI